MYKVYYEEHDYSYRRCYNMKPNQREHVKNIIATLHFLKASIYKLQLTRFVSWPKKTNP